MNVGTVDNAGTLKLKMLVMESIKEFPRGINSDQVISLRARDGECERAPGPGLKLQAASYQASGGKRQAPGSKLQASSHKRQAPIS
jgi:hypothetical protein